MDFTYLDYFNYYLKEFINEITSNFPDFEKNVVANYRELLESKQSKNDLYVKYFISKVNDYMEDICNRNTELFVLSRWFNEDTKVQGGLFLLEGVDFVALWNSSYNTELNQQAIWKYLQLLVLLGRRIVPNREEILEILNGVGGQVYAPAKVEKTLKGNDDNLDDSGNTPDVLGLGNLASLAGLMGIGSGEMPDLSSIVKTLGDVLGNFDMTEITKQMQEAQQEAEQKVDNNISESETTTDESENTTQESGTTTDESETTTDESETTTDESETTTQESGTTQNENKESLSSSTTNLFTDLAKEMTETFDFSSLEGEQPSNMGEAFSKFLSGNNPAKLMGLVSKFGSKLQKEVTSGNINQNDLLRDTQKMMSGLQGGDATKIKKQAEQMAKSNPALAQQMQQMRKQNQSQGDTRTRLQAKLASKRSTQNSDN
jgi:hypothetical protein